MSKIKKVLITGAGGFIGKSLYKFLSDSEFFQVIGIVRNNNKNTKGFFEWDLSKGFDFGEKVDAIIHTAGTSPGGNNNIFDYVRDNIYGAMNLINYAKKFDIKEMIYLASVSSYGSIQGILNENSPSVNPGEYGQTKRIAEEITAASGINYHILILPGVVGYGCNKNWLMNCAEKIYKNEDVIFYNGDSDFNNTAEIGDLCNFIEKLLSEHQQKSEKMLLSASDKMTIREILNYLKNKFQSSSKLIENSGGGESFVINSEKSKAAGFKSKKIKEILDIIVKETLRKYGNANF